MTGDCGRHSVSGDDESVLVPLWARGSASGEREHSAVALEEEGEANKLVRVQRDIAKDGPGMPLIYRGESPGCIGRAADALPCFEGRGHRGRRVRRHVARRSHL